MVATSTSAQKMASSAHTPVRNKYLSLFHPKYLIFISYILFVTNFFLSFIVPQPSTTLSTPVATVCNKPLLVTASPSARPPIASITTFHRKLLKSSCVGMGRLGNCSAYACILDAVAASLLALPVDLSQSCTKFSICIIQALYIILLVTGVAEPPCVATPRWQSPHTLSPRKW